MKRIAIVLYGFLMSLGAVAQTEVIVNLNMEHIVAGVSEFDRSKFFLLHSDIKDNEWDSEEQRQSLLEDYDVYLGRNNGAIVWEFNQLKESESKAGWPNLSHMDERGAAAKNDYGSDLNTHQFEDRAKRMIIGGQPFPMYPNGQLTNPFGGSVTPWAYTNQDAAAEFYANYLKKYFDAGGVSGKIRPTYIEVLNEPFVKSATLNTTNEAISEFHNVVARRVRQENPNVKVGGYAAAHPAFEAANFGHWNGNWKTFIDIAGDEMDFFSFHLYDFRPNLLAKESQRKGSNIEAIMDMIDHYSVLKLGERKPWYITEYGYFLRQAVRYNKQSDWYQIRSFNSMMMQLMERQDQIVGAIPFMILKAKWGTNEEGIPYGPRLLRQKKEVPPFEGNGEDWVYTDLLKFFELWKNVNGTRVDTYSNNPDMLVDAYVDDARAYVILSNLGKESGTVNLDIAGINASSITSVSGSHLYANAAVEAVLEKLDLSDESSVELGAEATMILTYELSENIELTETSNELKYFADEYLQTISSGQPINVAIKGVVKNEEFGEAILRIGVGRDHGLKVLPKVKVNNVSVSVPRNWKGDDQKNRDKFFGVMEIPVPYDLLKEDNAISITFDQSGGHVSSIAVQVFNQTTTPVRPEEIVSVEDRILSQSIKIHPNPAHRVLSVVLPDHFGEAEVTLLDIHGSIIYKYTGVLTLQNIDVSSLSSGVYMIKVDTDRNSINSRLIIE